ncbi:hypothetical protein L6164_031783 [Bauhinia variegata]|uniref:Uncharacterized protein n=1 Tax=Bauhinia variegata TaxID=167791 RepID=A0ACB9KLM0_BAUVA|nr:hypothetical protein L6164_031783 [Bauhinia variegata]
MDWIGRCDCELRLNLRVSAVRENRVSVAREQGGRRHSIPIALALRLHLQSVQWVLGQLRMLGILSESQDHMGFLSKPKLLLRLCVDLRGGILGPLSRLLLPLHYCGLIDLVFRLLRYCCHLLPFGYLY